MRNVLAICAKELRGYFTSPIGYVLSALVAVIFGFYFYIATREFVMTGMQMQFQGQNQHINVNEFVIAPLIGLASVIFLFLTPMITMRLFAEEKRSGTMELLMTSPVRDTEIVLGKWLGALTMYMIMAAILLIDFSLLFLYGNPDWKPMMAGFLGLLLQGGALLAIGTFISTLTKNQVIAASATFAVCLMLWVLSAVSAFDSGPVLKVISYLSVISHFDPFTKGIISLKDVVFYLSFIFLGLFLTTRSLESSRWRA